VLVVDIAVMRSFTVPQWIDVPLCFAGIANGYLVHFLDRKLLQSFQPRWRSRQSSFLVNSRVLFVGDASPTALLVTVGILEEAVLRGALIQLGIHSFGSAGMWMSLAFGTVVLILSHVHFGIPQAVAKVPLFVTGAALTAIAGSPYSAMAAHAWFNWLRSK
jgi:hypothetical protein